MPLLHLHVIPVLFEHFFSISLSNPYQCYFYLEKTKAPLTFHFSLLTESFYIFHFSKNSLLTSLISTIVSFPANPTRCRPQTIANPQPPVNPTRQHHFLSITIVLVAGRCLTTLIGHLQREPVLSGTNRKERDGVTGAL